MTALRAKTTMCSILTACYTKLMSNDDAPPLGSPFGSPLRQEIAQQAAIYIADHGLDYGSAKHKAMQEIAGRERLPKHDIPDHDDMDAALLEHLELFDSDGHRERLQQLRAAALRAMELLEQFKPFVSGAAWKGIASEQAFAHLQVFVDNSKDVEAFLIDQRITYTVSAVRHLRPSGNDLHQEVPALVIEHRGNPVVVALYPTDDIRGALKQTDRRGNPLRGDLSQFRQKCALNQDA
jgi:hypothetical protein